MNPVQLQALIMRMAGLAGNALAQALAPQFDRLEQVGRDQIDKLNEILQEIGQSRQGQAPAPGGGPGGGSKGPTAAKPGFVDKAGAFVGGKLLSIFGKMTAVLAPIVAMGTILNSTTSGFSVFNSAIRVLGATLGVLLLPIFVVLSAAVLLVSDMLQSKLLPQLGNFFKMVFEDAIRWAEAIDKVIKMLEKLGIEVGSLAQIIAFIVNWAVLPAPYNIARNVVPGLPGILNPPDSEVAKNRRKKEEEEQTVSGNALGGAFGGAALGAAKSGARDKSFADRFLDNMRLTAKEMRYQAAPKAQRMGLADAQKQAQMAAFNQSPFEQKMLDQMIKVLGILEQTLAEISSKRPRAPIVN